jgi:predicted transcriptional regulator
MAATSIDVRSELHELIDTIQNQSVLQAVYTLLAAQRSAVLPPAELSGEEAAAVAEGIRQLDAGEGLPHEQVVADIWAKYGR